MLQGHRNVISCWATKFSGTNRKRLSVTRKEPNMSNMWRRCAELGSFAFVPRGDFRIFLTQLDLQFLCSRRALARKSFKENTKIKKSSKPDLFIISWTAHCWWRWLVMLNFACCLRANRLLALAKSDDPSSCCVKIFQLLRFDDVFIYDDVILRQSMMIPGISPSRMTSSR